uniref:Reverse transcriptase domain-containing protein n=1 Tax=Cannabis sativa TaxID=3483 RepID=A0A803P323_CANSA
MGTEGQSLSCVRRDHGVHSPERYYLYDSARVVIPIHSISSFFHRNRGPLIDWDLGFSYYWVACSSLPSVSCLCDSLKVWVVSAMSTPEMNLNTMEEVMSLVENVTMDDFSVDLTPDDAVAQDTIKKTLVGKFFIKRKIGNGKLRSILSEMWNISPGWRLQEISPKIFIFRFSRESDALKVVGNGPWAPCGGFLLVTLMPDDGKWKSADLNHVNIWSYYELRCGKSWIFTVAEEAGVSCPQGSMKTRLGSYGAWGKLKAVEALRGLVRREDPDVLFLMEARDASLDQSKMRGAWFNNTLGCVDWICYFVYAPQGPIGSILSKFGEVFRSSGVPLTHEISDLINPGVSDDMNEELTRLPSEEEIRLVVWSMGPLKSPSPDGMPGCFYRHHWNTVKAEVVGTVQDFFRTGDFDRSLNHTFLVLIPKRPNAAKFDDFRPISLCNFAYKGRWIEKMESWLMKCWILLRRKREIGLCWWLDMSKVWPGWNGVLDKVLEAFGFDSKFRSLVSKCISSVSFSILLNGGPLKRLLPSRGLRQGDPLSPFLFILGSEVLSRLLLQAEFNGRLTGFKVCPQSPSISHLMFADDTFLFCKASLEEIDVLKTCLQRYCMWSGQMINYSKSAVVFSSNANDSLRSSIVDALGVRRMEASEVFLGNPLFFTKSKTRDFNFVVDKVKNRLEGWRCKLLSQAGRTTLLNSVITNIPIYTMSSFLLPNSICGTLDKLARKFWWVGNSKKDRFLALTHWDGLCRPKACGGLGGNFWNATLPSNASWGARGILPRESSSAKKVVGWWSIGHCVDLWTTSGPVVGLGFILGCLQSKLEFLESLRTFVTLTATSDDTLIWKDSPNGLFYVKVAHASLTKNRSGNVDVLFKQVWNSSFLERVKLFLWKVGKDILPCVDLLVQGQHDLSSVLSLDKQGEVIEAFSVKTWVKSPLERKLDGYRHAISVSRAWLDEYTHFLGARFAMGFAVKSLIWKSPGVVSSSFQLS